MATPHPILFTKGARDKKWLAYLVDVFREATGIALELREADESCFKSRGAIFYAPEPASDFQGIFIPESPIDETTSEVSVLFNGEISRGTAVASAEIPVHHAATRVLEQDGAVRSSGRLSFQFDLFRNAFLRLSCAAERRLERKDGPHHGYCPSSLPRDTYLRPIVDYLFILLKSALWALNPSLAPAERKSRPSPLILTHDIDAVRKTFLKSLKQSVMDLSRIPVHLAKNQTEKAFSRLKSSLWLPWGADDFDQIELWRELDRAAGNETAYYVYTRTPPRSLSERIRAAIFDPDYRVGEDPSLIRRLKTLAAEGCAIGLHGSFASYDDPDRLSEEKKTLEKLLDAPVDRIRQHWLRFRFDGTWRAQEEAGFAWDAGFGFNNAPGFRSWFTHPHHPWNEREQAPHRIKVIPMVAMDSTLFDYQSLTPPEILVRLKALFDETVKFGGQVCWNWHTHGASRHLNWQLPYRESLAQK